MLFFLLIYITAIICTFSNSNINHTLSFCIAVIQCPIPTVDESVNLNTNISGRSGRLGNRITYSCAKGYWFSDTFQTSSTAECLQTNRWSVQPPAACEGMDF